MAVERVEAFAHTGEHVAPVLASLVAGIAHYAQLDVEKLFKLEPGAGPFKLARVFRIVYCAQGFVAPHHVETSHHLVGQRLGQGLFHTLDEALGEPFDGTRSQPGLLHLLRSRVIWLQPHCRKLQRVGLVDVGVHHVDAPVEHRWLAEDDVHRAGPVCLLGILASVEPRKVHHRRAV